DTNVHAPSESTFLETGYAPCRRGRAPHALLGFAFSPPNKAAQHRPSSAICDRAGKSLSRKTPRTSCFSGRSFGAFDDVLDRVIGGAGKSRRCAGEHKPAKVLLPRLARWSGDDRPP